MFFLLLDNCQLHQFFNFKKVLSPTNASCAMKTIHQRLMEQTTHSTQSQTMAERMRQERMQELTNIQNRWQNGILKEDTSDSDQHDQAEVSLLYVFHKSNAV